MAEVSDARFIIQDKNKETRLEALSVLNREINKTSSLQTLIDNEQSWNPDPSTSQTEAHQCSEKVSDHLNFEDL